MTDSCTRQERKAQAGETPRELWVVNLGMVEYQEALALQKRLVAAKRAGELEADVLLLLEHPAVITLGRRGDESNVVASPDTLAARGIPVHRVERGGDVTYHGPGQLVGYPIVNLRRLPKREDIGCFVSAMQEAIIRTLASYDIPSERIEKVIGVWVRRPARSLDALPWDATYRAAVQAMVDGYAERKIAAIGARIEGWTSYHGFALNVNTDLTDFNLIVPCGLEDRGVTSMQAELGRTLEMEPIRQEIARHLAEQWGHELVWKQSIEEIIAESWPSPTG
ncbi:MAG: lipoyl(octanoyl) transferase LipB [Ardenticatenales bacterium]|nr:lipoyl(octanoyl) transferase LipB [Ardenticatenales bacterium]